MDWVCRSCEAVKPCHQHLPHALIDPLGRCRPLSLRRCRPLSDSLMDTAHTRPALPSAATVELRYGHFLIAAVRDAAPLQCLY